MNNRISTCVDNQYFPLFISFYNSYKHYEHSTKLNVYDFKGLNTFNIQYLQKYVDVTRVDFSQYEPSNNYFGTYAFKYHALLLSEYDNEILLDIDINFLNNIDYLFNTIESGKLVVAREGENWLNNTFSSYFISDDVESESNTIKNKLYDIIGEDANKFNKDYNYKNYNGGFLGINKAKFSWLLQQAIEILYDKETLYSYHFKIDQHTLGFLIDILNIDIEVLPQMEWMTTWNFHKEPRKSLKIENEKIVIKDEENNRLNIYHYTGDVGVKNSINGNEIASRMYFLTNDYFKKHNGDFVSNESEVKKLWFNKHQSSIYFAFKYFHYEGDIKCPMHYNNIFRSQISSLINILFDENTDEESPIVFTIALMYDYVNELGYKVVGYNKYYKILEHFLKVSTNDTKLTIGIDQDDCVVNLQIKNVDYKTSYHWLKDDKFKELKGTIVEYFNGVSITTNYDKINT
jgi:hypothetical protein